MPPPSDADPNFKCQRTWHPPWPLDMAAVLPSRPECTTQLAFRKVAAAFDHATFNNDAALVRGFGKAR
jgi:hypothetical protein